MFNKINYDFLLKGKLNKTNEFQFTKLKVTLYVIKVKYELIFIKIQ